MSELDNKMSMYCASYLNESTQYYQYKSYKAISHSLYIDR